MKKLSPKKNILLFLLIILLIVGFMYATKNNNREIVTDNTPVDSLEMIKKETDIFSQNVTLPHIPGNGSDISNANQFLKAEWESRLFSFEKDATESAKVNIELPPDIKSYAAASPSIEEKNDRYIAIFMGAEWYLRGAAHPAHTISTYVYDYQTKTFADTSSFFKKDSNFLAVLSDLAKADLMLQSKVGDVGYEYNKDFVEDGTRPLLQNFSRALPLKDGLMIYFEEYQVAPYAAGPQQVSIPYNKLKDIIDPTGVLGMYIK